MSSTAAALATSSSQKGATAPAATPESRARQSSLFVLAKANACPSSPSSKAGAVPASSEPSSSSSSSPTGNGIIPSRSPSKPKLGLDGLKGTRSVKGKAVMRDSPCNNNSSSSSTPCFPPVPSPRTLASPPQDAPSPASLAEDSTSAASSAQGSSSHLPSPAAPPNLPPTSSAPSSSTSDPSSPPSSPPPNASDSSVPKFASFTPADWVKWSEDASARWARAYLISEREGPKEFGNVEEEEEAHAQPGFDVDIDRVLMEMAAEEAQKPAIEASFF